MSSPYDTILSAWLAEMRAIQATSPVLQRIRAGALTRAEWASILIQLALQVREHPSALAAFTSTFRGRARRLTKKVLAHARSEAGHDQLALDDVAALGIPTERLPELRPLPATTALLGTMHAWLLRGPAVGYLGYVFHLEFLATHFGPELGRGLVAAGLPPESLTFLQEHATVDVAHNRLMQEYVELLVTTPEELDDVVYAARVTARLYDRLLNEAAEHAHSWSRYGYEAREAGAELEAQTSSPRVALVG